MSYSTGPKPDHSWPMTPGSFYNTRPRSQLTTDRTSTAPSDYAQPYSPVSGRQGQTGPEAPYAGPTISELMGTERPRPSAAGQPHAL